MDVQLYVYDLSRGMARAMSMQFLGIQIDAVYHTALVFGGVEHFFGAGIQTANPGSTHHGQPIEVVALGQTHLPEEVINEYLAELAKIYTPESYDLFTHNCNNFTNDFATFLVGKGIPSHITSLPETVLKTPFGQMLRPQLDQAIRGVTQAPVPPQNVPAARARPVANGQASTSGLADSAPAAATQEPQGKVHNITTARELDRLLEQARSSCASIFFTSQTCAPCRLAYPAYDELAEELVGKAVLIKVDISQAHDIAARYNIRATPTFITYLKGAKEDEWTGANPQQLKGNLRLLVQSAFPPHPHDRLSIRTFLRQTTGPTVYGVVPPLEKVTKKLGSMADEPAIKGVVAFIEKRNTQGAREAPLPDMPSLGEALRSALSTLPPESLFAAYDLFRTALADARVSSFFAEEKGQETLLALIRHVNNLSSCPYSLRLVAVHVGCNLFSSRNVMRHALMAEPELAEELVGLILDGLDDKDHANVRVAATSLALNLATAEHLARQQGRATLPSSIASQLTACLCHGIAEETESKDAIRGLSLALGRMVYKTDDDELKTLVATMEVGPTLVDKQSMAGLSHEDKLVMAEVGRELCGKGLAVD